MTCGIWKQPPQEKSGECSTGKFRSPALYINQVVNLTNQWNALNVGGGLEERVIRTSVWKKEIGQFMNNVEQFNVAFARDGSEVVVA